MKVIKALYGICRYLMRVWDAELGVCATFLCLAASINTWTEGWFGALSLNLIFNGARKKRDPICIASYEHAASKIIKMWHLISEGEVVVKNHFMPNFILFLALVEAQLWQSKMWCGPTDCGALALVRSQYWGACPVLQRRLVIIRLNVFCRGFILLVRFLLIF